jgi:putative FmdB family regulatory protein
MPTYEYICSACGHEFEKFQSITAAPVRECPICHKKKVERKISVGAGFIFKGSGFYETDYRNDSYKKAAEADKAPTPEVKAGDGKAVDAKPGESKSDAKPAETKAAEPKQETKVEAKPSASKSAAKPPSKKSPGAKK